MEYYLVRLNFVQLFNCAIVQLMVIINCKSTYYIWRQNKLIEINQIKFGEQSTTTFLQWTHCSLVVLPLKLSSQRKYNLPSGGMLLRAIPTLANKFTSTIKIPQDFTNLQDFVNLAASLKH